MEEEIRPEGRGARMLVPWLAGLCAIGLALLLLALTTNVSGRLESYGAAMFAVGGMALIYVLLWLRNSRLVLGPETVGERNFLGHTRALPITAIGRLVVATIAYSSKQTPQPVLYVLAPGGEALMKLNVLAWGRAAIERFAEATRRQIEYRDGAISAKAFSAEFPKAVSAMGRHPNLFGGGIVVVAVGLALGIPIALVLLHR